MGDDTLGMRYDMRRQARGAEPPTKDRPWRRRLLWAGIVLMCVGSLTGGFFVWRAIAYVRTVRASVGAAVLELSSGVSARLVELYVDEGDQVVEGQRLARLDDSQAEAALESAQATEAIRLSLHVQAQAAYRLVQARVDADIELGSARVEVASAAIAQAAAAVELRQARLADEVRLAEAQCEEARAWLTRLQKGTRQEDIEAARARLAAAKAMADLYELEVRQSEELVVEGIDSQHVLEVRKTRLTTQKSAVREAELELERLETGPTEEEIQAAAQGLAAREAALALARTSAKEIEGLTAELAMRKAELRQAQAQLVHAEARRTEVTLAEERVRGAAAELEKARADLEGSRAALDEMVIRSSVTGTVTRTYDKVGEICTAGTASILVADDSKGRWINGFVREKDALWLEPGQSARVKVLSGARRYVDAVIVQVGQHTDSVDREPSVLAGSASQPGQPELVWVKLRPVEPFNDDPLPGMTARVIIRVR